VLPCFPWIETAISATTRRRRAGEVDGLHYHFLDEDEFARRVAGGEFLEHVRYANNRYGTLRAEIDRILTAGRAPLVEIELRGARAVRASIPGALAVFIAPPSVEELARRLQERGTDDPADIAERMRTSEIELRARDEFDCVIVNDDRAEATSRLAREIVRACGAEEACLG
jgi:guanylate kinase